MPSILSLPILLLTLTFLLTTLAAANKPLLSPSPSSSTLPACPTCNPSTNSCAPGTSCIQTGTSSYCACAAGYKSSVDSASAEHFKLNLTGVYTPWNYTVFVAPEVSCGVPCEDWSAWTVGRELCAEVGLLSEEDEGCMA